MKFAVSTVWALRLGGVAVGAAVGECVGRLVTGSWCVASMATASTLVLLAVVFAAADWLGATAERQRFMFFHGERIVGALAYLLVTGMAIFGEVRAAVVMLGLTQLLMLILRSIHRARELEAPKLDVSVSIEKVPTGVTLEWPKKVEAPN